MALRELLASLQINVDSGDLKIFTDQLGVVQGNVAKFAGVLAGGLALGAIKSFVSGQIDAGDALGDMSGKLGVSSDDLQRFQFAVKATGGEIESAGTSLKFLNKNIGEAAGGNATTAKAFAALGVSVKGANGEVGSAEDLLPSIAEGISKLGSQGEKTAAVMSIFGKGAMDILPFLDKGADGVKGLFDEYDNLGGGLSSDFVDASGAAADELDRLEFVTAGLKSEVLTGLLPALTAVLSWVKKAGGAFVKFARQTSLVESVTKTLGVALGILAAVRLRAMVPQVWASVRAFAALRTSFFGVSVPIWAVVALLALVWLALDDLWALMNGGDSVIGKFLDKFGGVGSAKKLADDLRVAWDEINKSFAETGPFFADIGKQLGSALATALPYAIQAFVFLVKVIAAAVTLLGAFIASLVALPAAIKKGDFSQIKKNIDSAGDAVFGKSTSTIDPNSFDVTTSRQGGLFGATVPTPPGAAVKSVQQDNKNTVNIYGAGDPSATAASVTGALGKLNNDQNAAAFAAVGGA